MGVPDYSCMQVRPADPAAQHIQKYLTLARFRLGHILNLKISVVTDNRFHGLSFGQLFLFRLLMVPLPGSGGQVGGSQLRVPSAVPFGRHPVTVPGFFETYMK